MEAVTLCRTDDLIGPGRDIVSEFTIEAPLVEGPGKSLFAKRTTQLATLLGNRKISGAAADLVQSQDHRAVAQAKGKSGESEEQEA